MNCNRYGICGVLYNSKMDKEMGSLWLGCDAKGCQFWIHSSCYGFPNAEDDAFPNIEFHCGKHIQSKIKSKKIKLYKQSVHLVHIRHKIIN